MSSHALQKAKTFGCLLAAVEIKEQVQPYLKMNTEEKHKEDDIEKGGEGDDDEEEGDDVDNGYDKDDKEGVV